MLKAYKRIREYAKNMLLIAIYGGNADKFQIKIIFLYIIEWAGKKTFSHCCPFKSKVGNFFTRKAGRGGDFYKRKLLGKIILTIWKDDQPNQT
jgi:hypothetical protein